MHAQPRSLEYGPKKKEEYGSFTLALILISLHSLLKDVKILIMVENLSEKDHQIIRCNSKERHNMNYELIF